MSISTSTESIAGSVVSALPARLIAHLRSPLYWNGYALIFSSVASSGLGMVYWIIAARVYSPEAVGLNSAMIAAMMFLAGVSQFNLMSALMRFIPGAGRRTSQLVLGAYTFSMIAAIVAGFIFVSGLDIWSPRLAFVRSDPMIVGWFI